MEHYLEKIERNTRAKQSFQIVVSGNTTDITTRFDQAIRLERDRDYEIALVNLETYYSFSNINSTKNRFRYSNDSGTTWYDIYLPEGSYDISDIYDVIVSKMKQNGHYDTVNNQSYIILYANVNTLKAELTISANYQVDFTPASSISQVLGFTNQIYTAGNHVSQNVVNIISVNSILVITDIIGGSYLNGMPKPVIYSFFPNVAPGYKIIENPTNLVYLPINRNTIYSMQTIITDQNEVPLNLRGETVTMRFHIREV